MDLKIIEDKIAAYSPFVKEVAVIMHDGYPYAVVYPNFERLKEAHIINIEEEIRWYAVELYNMEVEVDSIQRVRAYNLFTQPLPKTESGDIDKIALAKLIETHKQTQAAEVDEPEDELYKALKSYITTISGVTVLPSSHLELDAGLDSLNYVELFTFVEESFNVHIDEVIFSNIMTMQDFYNYVKEQGSIFNPTEMDWKRLLSESTDEKLLYSPITMFIYQAVLYPFFKLYFRLEVYGLENIPKSSCIIAPSHQSMLDGFLMEASMPYKVTKNSFFLAFEAVFGTKILRPISNHGQTLLIDANNNLKRSMQRCALPLKDGKNLVIFPEGARTRDKKLLEFRPFFAMLSKTYDVPVVPVVIDGAFEALRAGKLFPRPKKIKITFLKPVTPKGLSYSEITKLTKEAIQNETDY